MLLVILEANVFLNEYYKSILAFDHPLSVRCVQEEKSKGSEENWLTLKCEKRGTAGNRGLEKKKSRQEK